jgi:hypothetical protein
MKVVHKIFNPSFVMLDVEDKKFRKILQNHGAGDAQYVDMPEKLAHGCVGKMADNATKKLGIDKVNAIQIYQVEFEIDPKYGQVFLEVPQEGSEDESEDEFEDESEEESGYEQEESGKDSDQDSDSTTSRSSKQLQAEKQQAKAPKKMATVVGTAQNATLPKLMAAVCEDSSAEEVAGGKDNLLEGLSSDSAHKVQGTPLRTQHLILDVPNEEDTQSLESSVYAVCKYS